MRLPLHPAELRAEALAPFHFGWLDDDVLVSTDAGRWALLRPDEMAALVRGEVTDEHPRHEELRALGLLRQGFDGEDAAARVRRRKAPIFRGPHLHILVVTLRCNHACSYCHASRAPMEAGGADMDEATARRAVDLALQSPAPAITIELQGGEPLANWPVVKAIIEYGRARNATVGKSLLFGLVSNLTLMDEEKLRFLVAPDIAVCTSLDGPADLHDHNRRLLGEGGSHAQVTHWVRRFGEAYAERGWDPRLVHVEALLTVTRASLSRAADIIDSYLEQGLRTLHVRGLNPYGFAEKAWGRIGYAPQELLAFHREVLERILALEREGIELREQTAAVFLTKLLTPDDPDHLDLRSPCGAGIGQLATDHDGHVYTCDEARMLARSGDPAFRLGHVRDATIRGLVGHPTTRAMAVASTLEALPGCSTCVYQPFCGVCPVQAWRTEGDLFGQRRSSSLCQLHQGQIELVLRLLRDDPDGHARRVFERWTLRRERELTVSCSTT